MSEFELSADKSQGRKLRRSFNDRPQTLVSSTELPAVKHRSVLASGFLEAVDRLDSLGMDEEQIGPRTHMMAAACLVFELTDSECLAFLEGESLVNSGESHERALTRLERQHADLYGEIRRQLSVKITADQSVEEVVSFMSVLCRHRLGGTPADTAYEQKSVENCLPEGDTGNDSGDAIVSRDPHRIRDLLLYPGREEIALSGYCVDIAEGRLPFRRHPDTGYRASSRSHFLPGFGTELVITTLIAIASIARRRPDLDVSETEEASSFSDLEKLAETIANDSGGVSGSISEYIFGKVSQRPTFIMGANDTLASVAEALYHDADVGWLIADLNTGVTRQYEKMGKRFVEIRIGELLALPVWDDIVEFKMSRPRQASARKLITIVRHTDPSREEIIAENLGSIVSPPRSAPASRKALLADWPEVTSVEYVITRCGTVVEDISFLLTNNARSRKRLAGVIERGVKVDRSVGT